MTESSRTPAAAAAPSAAAPSASPVAVHAQAVRAALEPKAGLPGALRPEPTGPRLLSRRKPDDADHTDRTSDTPEASDRPDEMLLAQAGPAVRQREAPAESAQSSASAPAAGGAAAEPQSAPAQAPGNPAAPSALESRLLTPWSQAAPWASTSWLSGLGAAPAGAVGTGALLTLAALGGGGGSGGGAAAPASDTSAPVLQSASISDSAGTQLVLSYSETVSSTLPAASAFEVLVDGVLTTVSGVARGSSDNKTVVLTLATAVTSPRAVSVSLNDVGAIKDLAGNTATPFRSQSVAITDKVAPTLLTSNAYTNAGSSVIVLRYAEDLLASGKPAASAFGVSVDGVTVNVTAVDLFGDSVRLTLGTAITAASPSVRLSYTPPSDSTLALQDAAGSRAASLGASGGISVTHSQDSTAPTLGTAASAAASVGQQPRLIRLTFTEALDASAVPAASSLSVDLSSGGSTRSVGVSAVKISGSVLELTLAETVSDTAAGLRVRYSPPASNPLQDWAGNDVAAFERSVTTVDAVAPTLVSSRFTSDRALELTFDETLASLGADKAAYTLTANDGAALKPVSSTVSGKTVTLTFDTAVQTGKAATLAYVAPANDATVLNAALQDATGNDSANLSYTADTTAPSLSSARTSTNGLQVELNYNESLLSPNASGTPVVPAVATSAFRVFRGGGLESTVSSVSVSGSQVLLTLASALLPGETVSVFYQAPTSNIAVSNAAIQDSSGNDAASLGSGVNGQAVVNRVAPAITGAVLDSQAAALDRVVVSFNEAISASTLPNISAFTVRVGGTAQTISSLSRSGNDLVIALTNPISSAGELRVAYSQPGTNALVDSDGNAVGSSDLAYGQVLTGTTGSDTLSGAAGRVDYLLGSLGTDTLEGKGAADHFVWPDFGTGGPGGFTQTIKDFGFKRGSGTLQGSTEADVLDLSQLLDGYTSGATLSNYLQFEKDANNKLTLKIDHNGGATFTPTATLVFDNVTVNTSNQVLAGGQLVSDGSDNLLLANVLTHLMAQGQLLVL
jgi:uncharacterized repeat protein (TIGR02059 family)